MKYQSEGYYKFLVPNVLIENPKIIYWAAASLGTSLTQHYTIQSPPLGSARLTSFPGFFPGCLKERKIRNVLVERLKYASNFIIFFPLYCRGSRIFLRKTLHLDPKKGENVTLTGLVESSSLLCFSLRDVRIPASFSRISSCIKKEIAFCIRKFVVNVFNKSKNYYNVVFFKRPSKRILHELYGTFEGCI